MTYDTIVGTVVVYNGYRLTTGEVQMKTMTEALKIARDRNSEIVEQWEVENVSKCTVCERRSLLVSKRSLVLGDDSPLCKKHDDSFMDKYYRKLGYTNR